MQTKSAPAGPEADLAFLRGIVEGGRTSRAGGLLYMSAGLLYGTQCLFHIGQLAGLIRWPDWATWLFVVAITGSFLAILVWAIRRDRDAGSSGPASQRGINAAFAGVGLANLAMIVVFAVNAARMDDFRIWLFYPAVVLALQGAAWYVAFALRRRGWMLATAIGWMLAAVALGLLVGEPLPYLAVCTVALFGLMALPGWIMLRQAREDA